MLSIHLKNLRFFAYHGLHPEEKVLGNNFLVNLHLHYQPAAELVTDINDTINYEVLFSMVQASMLTPTALLETLTMQLCYDVMERFDEVDQIFVSVEKCNPPIVGYEGGVVVSFQLARQQE
ncbi:MAG: dihydroneopterin aldolase [Bacteroidetes bacterium]|nr:MAG: dihydroneopterin aldolase [Bacteroidota bacterium]